MCFNACTQDLKSRLNLTSCPRLLEAEAKLLTCLQWSSIFPWREQPCSMCPSHQASSLAAAELAGHWGWKHNPRALTDLKPNPSLLSREFFYLLFSFHTRQALIAKYLNRSHSQHYKPILSVLFACTCILYTAL